MTARVWALDDPELKDGRLLVLLSLADHANALDLSWPSVPTLSKRTRICERQVQRVIQWLDEHGYIEIVEKGNGRGKLTRYKLTVKGDIGADAEPLKGDIGDIKEDIKGDIEIRKGDIGAPSEVLKGDIGEPNYSHARREPLREEPIEEPSGEARPEAVPPEGARDSTPDAALPLKQAMYKAVCDAVGWDIKTIPKHDKQEAAEVADILVDAGYSPQDMERFWTEVWAHDWRWKKHHERPKPVQIRQEIGKLRAPIPDVLFANVFAPAQSAGESAVDKFFARLSSQEHRNGH